MRWYEGLTTGVDVLCVVQMCAWYAEVQRRGRMRCCCAMECTNAVVMCVGLECAESVERKELEETVEKVSGLLDNRIYFRRKNRVAGRRGVVLKKMN